MITKINRRLSLQLVAVVVLLQACAPTASMKKPELALPEQYQGSNGDQDNAAKINFREFFEDADLLSLIEAALVNNREMGIMLQRMNMAQAEVEERKGEYLPFVGLGAGAEVEKVGHYTRNGAAERSLEIIEGEEIPEFLENYQFGLYAKWEVDIWKKLRNSAQAAALEYMASKEGRNFLVTSLVGEIADLYYELVSLDNHLVNLEQSVKLGEQGIEVIKQMKQYGRANLLAIKRLEGEVNKNKAHLYEIVQEIIEVENKINVLVGRVPQPVRRSSGGFLDLNPKIVQVGVPSQLLRNRPDIRKAELELMAANLNVDVAAAGFYPSLEIKAGYGFEAFRSELTFVSPESLALSLAGEVMAPVLNRSALNARFKSADAKQVAAVNEYEQTILNAFAEVSNKMANMENLRSQVELKSRQVDALSESVDLVNQLFKSARAEYLEVLLTQRESLESKMELIELKQKQIIGMVDLYRALGGGWH